MKAQLYCVKLRKDGSEYPEFELAYAGEVLYRFKADHLGEAGQVARSYLNSNRMRQIAYEWVEDRLETKEGLK